MASHDFDFFNFYEDYLWLHSNFTAYQDNMKKYSELLNRAGYKGKVLSGLGFNNPVGLDFDVEVGGAVEGQGIPLILTSTENVVGAPVDGSNPTYSLVVIRSKVEQVNDIPEPLNPTNTVQLNSRQTSEVVIIPGTPDVSPVFPAKLANDVILFGLKVPAGTSNLTNAMVDYSVSDHVRPNEELLKSLSNYDAVITKERGGTHQTLADLIADAEFGVSIRKAVVYENDVLENLSLTQNNVEIDFRKGVTMSKGSSATGLIIEGEGVKINQPRVADFNGGSDHAIVWRGDYGLLFAGRFSDCDNEYTDESTNGLVSLGSITE